MANIREAQLYCEDTAPVPRWILRWRDDGGVERIVTLQRDVDATLRELAVAVGFAIKDAGISEAEIEVFRVGNERRRGTITVSADGHVEWRAA